MAWKGGGGGAGGRLTTGGARLVSQLKVLATWGGSGT